jgi:hypothetical protein
VCEYCKQGVKQKDLGDHLEGCVAHKVAYLLALIPEFDQEMAQEVATQLNIDGLEKFAAEQAGQMVFSAEIFNVPGVTEPFLRQLIDLVCGSATLNKLKLDYSRARDGTWLHAHFKDQDTRNKFIQELQAFGFPYVRDAKLGNKLGTKFF